MLSSIFKLKNLLYIFQQEEYEIRNFLLWISKHNNWRNLEKKQKLVWTLKAQLIFLLSLSLFGGLIALDVFYLILKSNVFWKSLGIFLSFVIFLTFWIKPYYFLILAVLILKPIDLLSKKILISKAKQKLKKHPHLKIIGITGSYGKTSVKEFLHTLLQTKYKVLITPENINTPLGISALIQRENLANYDIFIVEMGAYRKGDIQQICDLVKPELGILTGINESHLERFGSLENTIQTKFELIESLPKTGKAFLNVDDSNIQKNHTRFGKCEQNIYSHKMATEIQGNTKGMQFKFKIKNTKLDFTVNFLGKHNIGNLIGAILVAQKLGLNSQEIQQNSQKIQAVKHRLQPIFNPNGIIVIDDSYNGNPAGVKSAIEVLELFEKQRKIFITPGLVELGEAKEKVHIKIGKQLAQTCDLIILMQNSNLPFLLEGLKQGGWNLDSKNYTKEKRLKVFEDSEKAHQALPEILKKGDVILFQNDWTDNYS